MPKDVTAEKSNLFVVEKGKSTGKNATEIIKGRQAQELVLGFCGPLGSGVSTVARSVAEILSSFSYRINYIPVSDFIKKNIEKILPPDKIDFSSTYKQINTLQDGGNSLRKKYGPDILAHLIINKIFESRTLTEKAQEQIAKKGTLSGEDIKDPDYRVATIIDGLKHPDEVELLKIVYGNMFYLFGVLCSESIRRNRLQARKEIAPQNAEILMVRDRSEAEGHGQQLLKTIHKADFFLRNSRENVNSLENPIRRFLFLILGKQNITPTADEFAMYIAQSAALKSGCLSRQVGAAIADKNGNIVATGCNDVPKYGGGFYTCEDGENDNRCMNISDNKCHNDEYKRRLKRDIKDVLKDFVTSDEAMEQLSTKIEGIDRIKNLIEYCRAVHAEMDAIVSAARQGKVPLKGCSLYCNLYPCHHCARHIVAAGIERVFFIEPYEKSLAIELHGDAIKMDPAEITNESKKVLFLHFEGVAPKQYMNLFYQPNRKDEKGILRRIDVSKERPVVPKFLDSHVDYEVKIVEKLRENKVDLDIS